MIERTMAGLAAARAAGRTGGNRRRMTPQDIEKARSHMAQRQRYGLPAPDDRARYRHLEQVILPTAEDSSF
jgi:hypothetical protein